MDKPKDIVGVASTALGCSEAAESGSGELARAIGAAIETLESAGIRLVLFGDEYYATQCRGAWLALSAARSRADSSAGDQPSGGVGEVGGRGEPPAHSEADARRSVSAAQDARMRGLVGAGGVLTHEQRIANYCRETGYPRSLFVSEDGRIVGTWIMGQNYTVKSGYYGGYPHGYLARVKALFPDKQNVLHLFSGRVEQSTLPGKTVDINGENAPDYVDDAQTLERVPLCDFDLVCADPPYSVEDCDHYKTTMVKRNVVMRALGKRLRKGTHVVWLDQVLPMYRKDQFSLEAVIGIVKSTNHRFRVCSIFRAGGGGAKLATESSCDTQPLGQPPLNDPKLSDGGAVRWSAWLGDVGCVVRDVTITEVITSDGRREFVDVRSECRLPSGQPLSEQESRLLAVSNLKKAKTPTAQQLWLREREALTAGSWMLWPAPEPDEGQTQRGVRLQPASRAEQSASE